MTGSADSAILSAVAALRRGNWPEPEALERLCLFAEQHFSDDKDEVRNYWIHEAYKRFPRDPNHKSRKQRLLAFGKYIERFQAHHWKPYRMDGTPPRVMNPVNRCLYNAHCVSSRVPTSIKSITKIVADRTF